ncbi:MAG TPA: hypothetical protein VL737_03985 [Candidatus Pristimantibacillus sp.]|jgi:hypothetical protein|nr:hypothetical protein [Candidatus Pristimantibacillus sp.]
MGNPKLIPGRMTLELSAGEARMYEWSGGDPDSLTATDDIGHHYLLREVVGAGSCQFLEITPRTPEPGLHVHAIVTPDERVIGTLVTRLVSPDAAPRNFIERVRKVADSVVGLLVGQRPNPELKIRVRTTPAWQEA